MPCASLFLAIIWCLPLLTLLPGARVFDNYTADDSPMLIEICDNAVDDDDDGLIDLNDPDCDCPVIEPVSLIPNPSFEDMSCCPSERSQLHCADTWIQASEPTTDYIHTCGWMGWPEYPPPLPFPDGEGIVGFRDGRVLFASPERNWKEYLGACLLGPLEKDIAYRFEFHVGFVDRNFSPPINITFFGTPDCDNLPFGVGNQAFGCPTNGAGWVRLGSVLVNGDRWVQSSISVTPQEDIYAIAIGPECAGVETNLSLYYFFDNLVLSDQASFDYFISETGHPCADGTSLTIPQRDNVSYQWYLDGVALHGETSSELSHLYGEGEYQVRILGENSCQVTKVHTYNLPMFIHEAEQVICNGETYTFGPEVLDAPGNYVNTFTSVDNCDSIVTLHLEVMGFLTDTIDVHIFEGEHYSVGNSRLSLPGTYPVHLISAMGCDSLLLVNLDLYKVYIPNVFSPNNDGVNDLFTVFGNEDLLQVAEMSIYSRSGGLIYRGEELPPGDGSGWNGSLNGEELLPGVYVYVVKLLMEDGGYRIKSGEVTLVR